MQYRDWTKRESQSKQVNPGEPPGGQTWKAGKIESREMEMGQQDTRLSLEEGTSYTKAQDEQSQGYIGTASYGGGSWGDGCCVWKRRQYSLINTWWKSFKAGGVWVLEPLCHELLGRLLRGVIIGPELWDESGKMNWEGLLSPIPLYLLSKIQKARKMSSFLNI